MSKFYNRELIDEVAELGMPFPEEIIINHGAAMVIRGIRDERSAIDEATGERIVTGDIDMATNLENNLYLENELGFRALQLVVGVANDGKERTIVSRRDAAGRFDVHRWDFSMWRYNRTGKGRMYLAELATMSDQDPVTGIWIAREKLVLLEKFETSRPKDADDIRRIEQFQRDGY